LAATNSAPELLAEKKETSIGGDPMEDIGNGNNPANDKS
jgi:hypothetical protein